MADATTEEWRTVPGHPDYMVSSLGRIRSYKMNKSDGILLRIGADYAGYRRVHLDGVHYYVHKAVALAWIGPCPDGMELHHINHDR
jgi:hypothetical protein